MKTKNPIISFISNYGPIILAIILFFILAMGLDPNSTFLK